MKLETIDLDTLIIDLTFRSDFGELELLGDSLLKGQQAPVSVGPLIDGKREVFDGNRRVRAAMMKGIKTLFGVVSERPLTESEKTLFQLVSDVTKKPLSFYERAMAILKVEDANPKLNGKELAALIDMEPTLCWKYQQARKLSPESMAAFKEGKIGLTMVPELAKLPHAEQPILLGLKLSGASREEVRKTRKKSSQPAVRASKIKCPLPSGVVVQVTGDSSLEEFIDALDEAKKLAKAAIAKGLNSSTAVKVWADMAAAG